MPFATRASFQARYRRTVDITLHLRGPDAPEETVRLREMSGAERDEFEITAFNEEVTIGADGKPEAKRKVELRLLRARLVAQCMVGEDGKRIYADDEIAMLADYAAAESLGVLFSAAQKLNGMEPGAVGAAAKNSASGQADASASASPPH